MKLVFVVVALLALICQINGFKVLGVLPIGSSSHFAIGNSILKSLHQAGHEVTSISSFPKKKPVDKYRDISVSDILERDKKSKKKTLCS